MEWSYLIAFPDAVGSQQACTHDPWVRQETCWSRCISTNSYRSNQGEHTLHSVSYVVDLSHSVGVTLWAVTLQWPMNLLWVSKQMCRLMAWFITPSDMGCTSRRDKSIFSSKSRGWPWDPHSLPCKWVPGMKRPVREADHSPPSSVEVNVCCYTSTPLCLHCFHSDKFTLLSRCFEIQHFVVGASSTAIPLFYPFFAWSS